MMTFLHQGTRYTPKAWMQEIVGMHKKSDRVAAKGIKMMTCTTDHALSSAPRQQSAQSQQTHPSI